MKTGEGKTLASTMPAYLNALDGTGVHVVTVNDYLAKRDSEWMGPIYRALGLSVGPDPVADVAGAAPARVRGGHHLRDQQRVRLRLPPRQHGHAPEDMVQRGHAYAIVDEVDSILIDEAARRSSSAAWSPTARSGTRRSPGSPPA